MKDREFLSKTLITTGAGLAIFSGGCGILFALGNPPYFSLGATANGEPMGFYVLPTVAMFGGIPCLIGTALYLWGKKMRRQAADKTGDGKAK